MDINPLPNQESDTDGDGMTVDYFIRLTSHAKFTSEQLINFLQNEVEICRYVVGRELIPQEHYHISVTTDVSLEIEDVKGIIRSFIIPFWQNPETFKLPVGFGNKQYNCQVTIEPDKQLSYILKDKDWDNIWFEGYEREYLELKKAESFPKKKPSDFKAEYQELCENFKNSDMDLRQFMVKFITLKAKYGQTVSLPIAHSYALSNLIQREPVQADILVNNYLDKY